MFKEIFLESTETITVQFGKPGQWQLSDAEEVYELLNDYKITDYKTKLDIKNDTVTLTFKNPRDTSGAKAALGKYLSEADKGIKKGDTVRIEDKYQDSKDDGKFEVVDIGKGRAHIKSLDSKLRLVPTEVVKIDHIYRVDEASKIIKKGDEFKHKRNNNHVQYIEMNKKIGQKDTVKLKIIRGQGKGRVKEISVDVFRSSYELDGKVPA